MTGSDLAKKILAHHPDMPIILATGYVDLPMRCGSQPAAPVQALSAGRLGPGCRQRDQERPRVARAALIAATSGGVAEELPRGAIVTA